MYQWTVALEEGEESAEDLPDPPACNAPMPKPRAGGEEADGEEEDNGEEDDDGERAKADVWSGDNEDIVQKQDKVRCATSHYSPSGSFESSGK